MYYENNKENLQKQARQSYGNLSEEEKDEKELPKELIKNISEKDQLKLKEYIITLEIQHLRKFILVVYSIKNAYENLDIY